MKTARWDAQGFLGGPYISPPSAGPFIDLPTRETPIRDLSALPVVSAGDAKAFVGFISPKANLVEARAPAGHVVDRDNPGRLGSVIIAPKEWDTLVIHANRRPAYAQLINASEPLGFNAEFDGSVRDQVDEFVELLTAGDWRNASRLLVDEAPRPGGLTYLSEILAGDRVRQLNVIENESPVFVSVELSSQDRRALLLVGVARQSGEWCVWNYRYVLFGN